MNPVTLHAPLLQPSRARYMHSGQRFHAVLRNTSRPLNVLMEKIDDRAAVDRRVIPVQIIGAGDADVPGAEIAPVPIVTGVPVDPVDFEEACPDRAAVTDPIDVGNDAGILRCYSDQIERPAPFFRTARRT